MDNQEKIDAFVQELLTEGLNKKAADFIQEEFRAEDIIDILNNVDQTVSQALFSSIAPGLQGELLSLSSASLRSDLFDFTLANFTPEAIASMLSDINDDDLTDIIMDFPLDIREKVLLSLPLKERLDIKKLMQYPEDTAGGIMTTEYFSVPDNIMVKDVKTMLKGTADIESLIYIYVLDKGQRLVGMLSLHDLMLSYDDEAVMGVMRTDLITADPYTDQEDAARIVEKYDLIVLPVIDENKRMLGIITVDDIIDVIREEQTEDLYKTVGTAEEEIYTKNIFSVARLRLPWLISTFFGSMFSAWLLSRFNRTLHEIILLTSFVPVITAMGGNIGSQTSTIVVRGLAMGYINLNRIKETILRELGVASIMGLLVGAIISVIAFLWHGNMMLGLILGISMVGAVTVASIIGTLAPFTFKRLNIDPAIAAGPMVTTANDSTGILIYLGLATLLLEYLR